MKNILVVNKNKIGTIAVCGVLFIATAATTVFASTPIRAKLPVDGMAKVVSSQKSEMSTLVAKGETICAVFDEDGNIKNVPLQKVEGNNAVAKDKTELPSDVPVLTQPGGSVVVMVKIENGVNLYSIDYGKTWNKNAPTDGDISNDKTKTPSDIPFQTATKSVMVKLEKGVMLYSIDAGKTWSKNAPTDDDIKK